MTTLKTIKRVPLARVGTWSASTGTWECTREQLADAVRAQTDPAFRTPVLKVGHVDPRFNADGEPAVGRVTNLTLDEDGDVLVGDLTDVPAWLADIASSAYPSRSVEMNLGVTTEDGAEYAGVLTAVALLGVTAPAVENLADVAALYAADVAAASPGRWTSTSAVAASALPATPTAPAAPVPSAAVWPPLPDLTTPMTAPGGAMPITDPTGATTTTAGAVLGNIAPATTTSAPAGPSQTSVTVDVRTSVRAAADLDAIRPAFYEWVDQHEMNPAIAVLDDAWVCEVWTDALIVDDCEGHYWRVTWTETNGDFTFGTPQRVTRTYTPVADTVAARAAHQAHRPLRYFRGRDDVVASSPKENAPVAEPTPTAPQTLTGLAERLGLAADASPEAVLAAIDDLKAAKPAPSTDTTPSAPAGPSDQDIAALVDQKVAAATGPLLEQLGSLSTELAERKAAEKVTRRETILAAAVKAGKITPAQVEQFSTQYDAAPGVVEALLDTLAPGTAMPVMASGYVGAEPTQTDELEAEFNRLFPSSKEA